MWERTDIQTPWHPDHNTSHPCWERSITGVVLRGRGGTASPHFFSTAGTRPLLPLTFLDWNAFHDYVYAGGRRMPADLQPLVNCTHVIPSSTAECERRFSHMNIIVSDTRSMLLVSHLSSLLFIKLHGPPLKSWNPTTYAKTRLRKHRSATDTQTRVAVSQDQTKDPLWQFFWRVLSVRVCRPKLFKNLYLSLVSGVPPLLF